jgi:hypothetical protein
MRCSFPFNHSLDLGSLVIRNVVRDQVDLGTLVVTGELCQEIDEGISVEPRHESKMPFRVLADSDCTHDFDTLANRRRQDLEAHSYRCPSVLDRSGLLKARFILVQQKPFLSFRFFLLREGLRSAIVPPPFHRLWKVSW